MIGPTHVAIAASIGMLCGVSNFHVGFMACGALLPDLDTEKSVIGRIFIPISIPLSRWLGHRGAFHSFWLWGIVCCAFVLNIAFLFIGIGALLHIVADCWTVSGVRAMTPFSQKVFVLFHRAWRFKTASRSEMIVLFASTMIAFGGRHVGMMGGFTSTISYLMAAPKLMVEEYRTKGLEICNVEGKFRWNSGKISDGNWLIVGTEGTGIAFLENKKIITPAHGKFLKARLKPTGKYWKTVKVDGVVITNSECYLTNKGKWRRAAPSSPISGEALCQRLSFKQGSDSYKMMIREINSD